LVAEIKIIKSISYTISTKKAGFRELGTLIALIIIKIIRRGVNKRKENIIELGLTLVTEGCLWSLISDGCEFSIQKL